MKYLQEIRNKFAREEIYPISNYFTDAEEVNLLERSIAHIKRNKRVYKQLIVALAIVGLSANIGFAQGMEKFDRAGLKFLTIARKIAYWALIIKATSDVMKKALAGDLQSISSTVIKYVIAYATLYFLPFAFSLVEDIF